MIPKMKEYKERWAIESDDSIKPGLEAVQQALQMMGNPAQQMKIIHVTGTNGKGSTIAFMESILKAHGYSTGVFSSPAIIDIHDQIRIDGAPISEANLDASFKKMSDAGLSNLLTEFELLTVAAFVTFEQMKPDYILLETGMGGLLDSTNVVRPTVSVITSIAIDHAAFLGTTIEEVSRHKAGIIKEGVPVVTGPLEERAAEIVRSVAAEQQSELKMYGMEEFRGTGTEKIRPLKMKGPHQRVNAEVAVEALRMAELPLIEAFIKDGIEHAQLAHRFHEISPNIFLDGAHNPAAAKALAETIRSEFPGEQVDFVIGMLKRKEIKQTLEALQPVAASFTFLTFSHPEAATGEELMAHCQHIDKMIVKLQDDALTIPRREGRKVVVTGSLYLLANLTFNSKSS